MQDYFQLQTSELVEKKVQQLFVPKNWPEVWAILNAYTDASSMNNSRVHLAILKLSNGYLTQLRSCLQTANQDPRDVIAPAEYPNQLRYYSKKIDTVKQRKIIEIDAQQYLNWLNDDSS